jgi:hypothetical protein
MDNDDLLVVAGVNFDDDEAHEVVNVKFPIHNSILRDSLCVHAEKAKLWVKRIEQWCALRRISTGC